MVAVSEASMLCEKIPGIRQIVHLNVTKFSLEFYLRDAQFHLIFPPLFIVTSNCHPLILRITVSSAYRTSLPGNVHRKLLRQGDVFSYDWIKNALSNTCTPYSERQATARSKKQPIVRFVTHRERARRSCFCWTA